MKIKVAKAIAEKVKDGQVIGLGTGSTADLAIEEIAKRVRDEKLIIRCLSSSRQSTLKAESLDLVVLSSDSQLECDWGFDGADSVDKDKRVIKGKGGAMLSEKILAAKCKEYIIIVDDSKLVDDLAKGETVPVEVLPESSSIVRSELLSMGARKVIERKASSIYGSARTERGNVIFDVRFSSISETLESDIKSITGVIESGLFLSQADKVWIGRSDGIEIFE